MAFLETDTVKTGEKRQNLTWSPGGQGGPWDGVDQLVWDKWCETLCWDSSGHIPELGKDNMEKAT